MVIPSFSQTTFSCTSSGTTCACTYGTSFAEFYAGYHGDVQTFFSSNTPSLTRNDATINYTTDNGWGSIVPPASGSNANPDTYSTRWSGRIYLAAGTYTFWLTSDDGSYFWLGGNALVVNPTTATAFINNGGLHSPTTVSSVGIFTANCLQDFKLHFGEQGGNNRCALEYACTALGIARQAVPAGVFCPCMSITNLPVELESFNAVANKDNILVKWTTSSERNNRSFTVFKSRDGESWQKLAVRDALPNSGGYKEYTVRDDAPYDGINYYYLVQTDMDGTEKKYDVVTVDFRNSAAYIKIFPNPATDKFLLLSTSEWKSNDVVSIYDALGLPVQVPVRVVDKTRMEFDMSLLSPATYLVKIQTAKQVIYRKVIKE